VARPIAPFIKFKLFPDHKEATLQLKEPGTAYFSAFLEGTDVSPTPVEKTVEASYISLKKALWCYANGKRRTETGWEEENYIHISLEGITRIDSKLDEFRGITRYILTTHAGIPRIQKSA